MISSSGIRAVLEFRRLSNFLTNASIYDSAVGYCHSIICGFLADFVERKSDVSDVSKGYTLLELLEKVEYGSSSTFGFHKDLEKLCKTVTDIKHCKIRNIGSREFYKTLRLVDSFMIWYKGIVEFEPLFRMYSEYRGPYDTIDMFSDTEDSKDYFWWYLGYEPLAPKFLRYLESKNKALVLDLLSTDKLCKTA